MNGRALRICLVRKPISKCEAGTQESFLNSAFQRTLNSVLPSAEVRSPKTFKIECLPSSCPSSVPSALASGTFVSDTNTNWWTDYRVETSALCFFDKFFELNDRRKAAKEDALFFSVVGRCGLDMAVLPTSSRAHLPVLHKAFATRKAAHGDATSGILSRCGLGF